MTDMPPLSRVLKALVVASAVAAWPTLLAIPVGPLALLIIVFGFIVALAHALLPGLAFFVLLSQRGIPSVGITMLAGGLIGALPVTILISAGGPQWDAALASALFPASLFGFCGWLAGGVFHFMISSVDDAVVDGNEKGGPLPDRPIVLPEPEA
jgi:hypothetical protein